VSRAAIRVLLVEDHAALREAPAFVSDREPGGDVA
jgi:hypothetical protein